MPAKKKSKKRIAPIPYYEAPGKRYYINQLNFLLNFLNADIEKLPPGAFSDLFYQLLLFFYKDRVENKKVLRTLFQDTDEDRTQLGYIQEVLQAKIESLKFFEEEQKSDEEIKLQIIDDAKVEYILKDGRISVRPCIKIYPYDIYDDDIIDEAEMKDYVMNISPSLFKFERNMDADAPEPPSGLVPGKFSKFSDEDIYGTIKFAFYSLLEKIPLSTINRCPHCLKYFRSTSKKLSPLCARCLKKENTYKWREQNRPVYNEYQRNLQKGVKTSVKDIRAKNNKK